MLQASSGLGHAVSCCHPLVCQGHDLDLNWPRDFRMVEASSDFWACFFVLSSPSCAKAYGLSGRGTSANAGERFVAFRGFRPYLSCCELC